MSNTNLNDAKYRKIRQAEIDDEFYTHYEDIEKELSHYDKKQFWNKTVYCNCDDYRASNFYKYFKDNFHRLKLKKLVATAYAGANNLFERPKGIIAEYAGSKEITGKMNCNGDFRNDRCLSLLEESDIVATNPPWSLFPAFLRTIVHSRNKFVVIGPLMATTNKIIYPYVHNAVCWMGIHSANSYDRRSWQGRRRSGHMVYQHEPCPLSASIHGSDGEIRQRYPLRYNGNKKLH